MRETVDERTGTPDPTRTGTIPDNDYQAVMAQYEELVADQGELLAIADEINGEVVQRSARNAIEDLDRLEATYEQVRLCNLPARESA